MKTQRSPNRWSCLPASFAMALDVPLDSLLRLVGHDGSDVWWPELPEPLRRRSFHIQELVWASWNLGYTITPFEALPASQGSPGVQPIAVSLAVAAEVRMRDVMRGTTGVITGVTPRGQRHAVAWNGEVCYDPNGTTYGLENLSLECFWAIKSR